MQYAILCEHEILSAFGHYLVTVIFEAICLIADLKESRLNCSIQIWAHPEYTPHPQMELLVENRKNYVIRGGG